MVKSHQIRAWSSSVWSVFCDRFVDIQQSLSLWDSESPYYLLHKLLTGPPQKHKCFSEIFGYPTNLFIWIVTRKSISKLRICLSCGWTQTRVVYQEEIFACGHICRGVKFQNKNLNNNQKSVLLNSLIMLYAYILLCAYVLRKKLPITPKHMCT